MRPKAHLSSTARGEAIIGEHGMLVEHLYAPAEPDRNSIVILHGRSPRSISDPFLLAIDDPEYAIFASDSGSSFHAVHTSICWQANGQLKRR
jgi:hypothetical protein